MIDENDNFYFCEINFRNSTWSYASTCAGMNLPVLWSQGMSGTLSKEQTIKPIKPDFIAVVEINDFKDRVLGKRIKLLQWIKELRKADCSFYLGKNDIKPVCALFLSVIIAKIKS